MIAFVPLEPWHIPAIDLQPAQIGALGLWTPALTLDYGYQLSVQGPAWAGIDGDGNVIGAAGFSVIFPTQASAWALFSGSLRGHTRAIMGKVRSEIAGAPWARIEAIVRASMPEAASFARHCGFFHVATLRNHGPACETMELFEVVKDAAD